MCNFQEKMFLLCPYEEMTLTLQTAHGNFLILCQMFLLANIINFLISKQNKTPQIYPKMLKQ